MEYVRTMGSRGHLTVVFSKAARAVAAPRKKAPRKLGILRSLPVAEVAATAPKGRRRGRP